MPTFEIAGDLRQTDSTTPPFPLADHRREPRYVPGVADAYVGWWEGESFRAELGTLRNFSVRGAAIELEADLGDTEGVWLCVVGPGRVIWMPARLVGRAARVLRIQFAEPFADDLFELLV